MTLADAEAAADAKAVRYGRDGHYDVISAFIKSIRGSDADAGLYWLARMLEAGEDPRFIARRLVILASEDIGLADDGALLVADAAARAVEYVGLPEAQLNLAHAVVRLATAPKSNRVTEALGRAAADARTAGAGEVPMHLRDAHYQGAKISRSRRRVPVSPQRSRRLGRSGAPSRPKLPATSTTSPPTTVPRPPWPSAGPTHDALPH